MSANTVVIAYTQNFVTIPFGESLETVLTLDSFMSQWAASVATSYGAGLTRDPVLEAMDIARSRCTAIATPDCFSRNDIAQGWGMVVAEALAQEGVTIRAVPDNQQQPPTVTPYPTPVPPSSGTPTPATSPASQPASQPASSPGTYVPTPRLNPALALPGGALGGPVTFGISIVTSIVSALFGGLFGGGDTAKVAASLESLRTAVSQTVDKLYRFSWTIAYALGKLLSALHTIWTTFLDALWSLVKNIVQAVWKLMSEVLPKIVQTIRQLRTLLDEIYRKYIRPVMNWIQIARRYLAILKAFHVPFADKLDAFLVKIQGKIIGPYLYVLRQLNGVGNWVNLIVTTQATIQRPVFLRTAWANKGALTNLWYDSQMDPAARPGFPSGIPLSPIQTQQQATAMVQLYASPGGAESAPEFQAAIAQLRGQIG